MGHSTWADVAPFVIHDVFVKSHYAGFSEADPEGLVAFLDPGAYVEGEHLSTDEAAEKHCATVSIDNLSFRGWKYYPHDPDSVGTHGRLWGHAWCKGPHKVWLINESEYSNIGQYNVAVIANDRAALEAFQADFEITKPVVEMDAVTQSG